MIEKIFIVFVVMEAFGLVLHILDSIRCWGDRIYYRKQQEIVNKYNDKMYESKQKEESNMKRYMEVLTTLQSSINVFSMRLNEVENKLKSIKKTSAKKGETK